MLSFQTQEFLGAVLTLGFAGTLLYFFGWVTPRWRRQSDEEERKFLEADSIETQDQAGERIMILRDPPRSSALT